jgi:hypothetical protein
MRKDSKHFNTTFNDETPKNMVAIKGLSKLQMVAMKTFVR